MKNTTQLNTLAKRIHKLNHQWWHHIDTGKPIERNKGELLMLAVTELAEAVEGIRKNLMDDKLPHRKMEEVEMADAKIRLLDFAAGFKIKLTSPILVLNRFKRTGNKGEQILDICDAICSAHKPYIGKHRDGSLEAMRVSIAIALIEKYCSVHRLDLDGAVKEKLKFNKTRPDHKAEARRKAGGKKF